MVSGSQLRDGHQERPGDRLKTEAQKLVLALGERALSSAGRRVEEAAQRLTDYAAGGGGPGLMAAVIGGQKLAQGKSPVRASLAAAAAGIKEKVKQLFGGGGGRAGQNVKVTNIVESIDVGLPLRTTYDLWTNLTDFPSFMKKVEHVGQESDTDLSWKAQVFWSHRTWKSTIKQQVPDERIVWHSEGAKGYVNGAVTFHALAPTMTRILVVLEYHPQGLFERTGNIWRAQGRRARLELKHFRRHAMTQVIHPEEVQGWRGVIEDGEVIEAPEAGDPEADEFGEEYGEDEYEPGEPGDFAATYEPDEMTHEMEADQLEDACSARSHRTTS